MPAPNAKSIQKRAWLIDPILTHAVRNGFYAL